MKDLPTMSVPDLEKRYRNALLISERSVKTAPDVYRNLKRLLRDINSRVLDISEYYPTAIQLTGLLRSLSRKSDHSIFNYFIQSIDPCQSHNVRNFRFNCLDLADQLQIFDKWRADRHHLERIK